MASQSRSFCYVDNLIDGMIRLINSRNDLIGPINIASPNEFTILDLTKKSLSKRIQVRNLYFYRCLIRMTCCNVSHVQNLPTKSPIGNRQ